jgi:hypothetical protein
LAKKEHSLEHKVHAQAQTKQAARRGEARGVVEGAAQRIQYTLVGISSQQHYP